jgi:cytochrome c peroxidase
MSDKGNMSNPASTLSVPTINSPAAQLGMKLFYSKALSGDMDTACVTCHHPMLGGGDGLSLSVGVEAEMPDLLGPGRVHSSSGTDYDGGPTVPRNAPTTFNIMLWEREIFHDGRLETLPGVNNSEIVGDMIITPDSGGIADANAGSNLTQAQARFPVTSAEEMRGHTFEHGQSNDAVRDHLAERIKGASNNELTTNNWLDAFRDGFSSPTSSVDQLITFNNITAAIAEYENSQTFINTPWKAYLEGDLSAVNEDAKQGAILFYKSPNDGGAGCASCHSGSFFSDEGFHVSAFPQVGRGKGDGTTSTDDFGRFKVTAENDDRYAFRTPSLINVEVTGPWGHAGSFMSLEDTVRYHLNPADAFVSYDASKLDNNVQTADMAANTQNALNHLKSLQDNDQAKLKNVDLSDTEVNQLLAFILTLTDPCVKDRACLAPWIPAEGFDDPDGLRVNAVDENTNLL